MHQPPRDSCAFYSTCLESRFHCGPDGYPIGFGQKFCEKFSAGRSSLSAEGINWMLSTMNCLQNALVPDATSADGTTCDALEKKAFGSHAKCYVDNGVCKLGLGDWKAIVEIVDLTTLFDSFDALKASLAAGAGCAEYAAFLLKQKVKGIFDF